LGRKKICIITQSHLCRNPRVLKEALALSADGYRVVILNSTYSSELHNEDLDLIKNTDIELIAVAALEKGGFMSFVHRLTKKLGDTLVKKLGLQTHLALGYASGYYKGLALKQNADLYIAHQELGLYCGVELLKAGKKVVFDLEDWYSEDLLDTARSYRPIRLLRKLEETALKTGSFCMVPSNAMGQQLAKTYNSNTPVTIYNTFDLDKHIISRPKTFDTPIKLFWFSQTIGPGRGLEQFIEIANQLNPQLEIHLLGKVSSVYQVQLTALLQSPHSIFFHPLVPAQQLAAKIAEFDIGLALELTEPLSRKLTVTNKLFQYMLSGLVVIATNTDGQKEIIDQYGGGMLIDYNDMAASIKDLQSTILNNPIKLQSLQKQTVLAAKQLNWQHEKTKLLELVSKSLN
jgi:glycosyltransferase involved in cell wall biosynthesis